MLRKSKVAAVQMISSPSVDANLKQADELVKQAAHEGAKWVTLPEYFFGVCNDEQAKVRLREQLGKGYLQDFLSDCAKRHNIWLAGGSIPMQASDDTHVRNTNMVYDNTGKHVARYDKIHLFTFHQAQEAYDEARTIEGGDQVLTLDTPVGKAGLAICYDLRFPELFRKMGPVDFISLPAAFTATTGKAHWEVLLRARAIENQCYVLASAQGGVHPTGRHTFGHSMLVDPWGNIQKSMKEGVGVVVGEIDLDYIASVRKSLPALTHQRLL